MIIDEKNKGHNRKMPSKDDFILLAYFLLTFCIHIIKDL